PISSGSRWARLSRTCTSSRPTAAPSARSTTAFTASSKPDPPRPVIEAVVFDLGGVVMDSPLHAIARFERDQGLPAGAINGVGGEGGETGAWARLGRGGRTLGAFCAPFEADCRAAGVELSGAGLRACIAEASVPRPRMLEAIRRIRARG